MPPIRAQSIPANPTTTSNKSLIMKPPGEVNRPGRGGYAFDRAVGWSPSTLKEVKIYVKEVVLEELDWSKSFTKQSPAAMDAVRAKVLQKFGWMDVYVNSWAIDDLVQCRLALERKSRAQRQTVRLAKKYREDMQAKLEQARAVLSSTADALQSN
ncbi:hypothetical protein EV360DRAFT_86631 [Lentinula raphanica]|nr:hypothetical protein EV360DRAFT_86631 [Lentinula raphanica]